MLSGSTSLRAVSDVLNEGEGWVLTAEKARPKFVEGIAAGLCEDVVMKHDD